MHAASPGEKILIIKTAWGCDFPSTSEILNVNCGIYPPFLQFRKERKTHKNDRGKTIAEDFRPPSSVAVSILSHLLEFFNRKCNHLPLISELSINDLLKSYFK